MQYAPLASSCVGTLYDALSSMYRQRAVALRYLMAPGQNLMGKKQVLKWVEEDVAGLKAEGYEVIECMQRPGDVLIVPELWGHAVLNTQDAIAVASEVAGSNYRLPIPRAYRDLSRGLGLGHAMVRDGRKPSLERDGHKLPSHELPPHKRELHDLDHVHKREREAGPERERLRMAAALERSRAQEAEEAAAQARADELRASLRAEALARRGHLADRMNERHQHH